MAVPAPADERESVSIRKIANGYLIEKSGTRRGKYFSHTEYSAGRPVIAASVAKKPAKEAPRPRRAAAAARNDEVGYLRGH